MINLFFKSKTYFWSLLAISSIVTAAQVSCSELTLEGKTGYFFFSNSKMRKVYDNGGLDVQLCATYPLYKTTCRWTLNAYGALEYFYRSGKSIHGNQKTALWSVPINIGFKPVYAINADMQYYFSIGPRYFYIHQHNHSSYVSKNRSRNGLGFFVNTGLNYILCDCFVIDIFGEYSHAKTHFHGKRSRVYTRNIQIGGITFGGGVGCEF
jgi:hypothetical protein